MSRTTTVYHLWCECDPAGYDVFVATKAAAQRQAASWRRECRKDRREWCKRLGEPYRPPQCCEGGVTIRKVRVPLTRRGIAEALTTEPMR